VNEKEMTIGRAFTGEEKEPEVKEDPKKVVKVEEVFFDSLY
jgi:hypothetical protein